MTGVGVWRRPRKTYLACCTCGATADDLPGLALAVGWLLGHVESLHPDLTPALQAVALRGAPARPIPGELGARAKFGAVLDGPDADEFAPSLEFEELMRSMWDAEPPR